MVDVDVHSNMVTMSALAVSSIDRPPLSTGYSRRLEFQDRLEPRRHFRDSQVNFEGTNGKGDAVDLTTTSGGGWLSVGMDSEAVVVSQTADCRRWAGVGEFWGEFENHEHAKKEIF